VTVAVTVAVIVAVAVGWAVAVMVSVAPGWLPAGWAVVITERATIVAVAGRLLSLVSVGATIIVAVAVDLGVAVRVAVGDNVRVGRGVAVRVTVGASRVTVGVGTGMVMATVPVIGVLWLLAVWLNTSTGGGRMRWVAVTSAAVVSGAVVDTVSF
jgi:hypothetical protein